MGKNIVVFSDGTGQAGGTGSNTNVYKTFNLILDRSPRQVSFYDQGLGTGFRKVTGNILGRGFSENIRECYEFIFENYRAGDQIFLFGFSRGQPQYAVSRDSFICSEYCRGREKTSLTRHGRFTKSRIKPSETRRQINFSRQTTPCGRMCSFWAFGTPSRRLACRIHASIKY